MWIPGNYEICRRHGDYINPGANDLKHGSTAITKKKLGDLIGLEGPLIDISLSSFQTNPQFYTAMGSSLYNGPMDALLRYYQSLTYEFICLFFFPTPEKLLIIEILEVELKRHYKGYVIFFTQG